MYPSISNHRSLAIIVLLFLVLPVISAYGQGGPPTGDSTDPVLGVPVNLQSSITTGGRLDVIRNSIHTDIPLDFATAEGSRHRLQLQIGARHELLDDDFRFDVPSELYSVWIGPMYSVRINNRWSLAGSVRVSHQSDLDTNDDALRVTGFAGVDWKYSEKVTLNFGIAYLDRENLAIVGGPGFDWRPNDLWRVTLRPPMGRIERKMPAWSARNDTRVYASARIAGGSYAVERINGTDDVLTISEFPLTLGIERAFRSGRFYVEAGYSVGRDIEYEDGGEDESIDSGPTISAGVRF